MPIARRLEEEDLLRDEYDALLVQIEGVLLDTNVQDGRTVYGRAGRAASFYGGTEC